MSSTSTRLNSPTHGFSHIFIPRILASSLLFLSIFNSSIRSANTLSADLPEETSPYLAVGGWEIRTHTGGKSGDTN